MGEESTQLQVESLADVLTFARWCRSEMPSSLQFRGQSKPGLPLMPKIFRPPYKGGNQEKNVGEAFRLQAQTRSQHCPEYHDVVSWVTLMQHYGAPTRLLDWSASALVATYFACDKDDDADGEVFSLSVSELNKSEDGKFGGPYSLACVPALVRDCLAPPVPLFKVPFEHHIPEEKRILGVVAPEIDIRFLVQQSVFTIHPPGLPVLPRKDDWSSPLLRVLRVPWRSKKRIRSDLQDLAITRVNLFPDLPTLGADCARLFEEDWFLP